MCPIDAKRSRSGLRQAAASISRQAAHAARRPRAADTTAAIAHAAGTNNSPATVRKRTSAWRSIGTANGAHSIGPYGSGASHGTR